MIVLFIARDTILNNLLKEVEQVDFVSSKENFSELIMMGREFCINATLALASTLNNNGKLLTSNIRGFVSYTNKGSKTNIKMNFDFK